MIIRLNVKAALLSGLLLPGLGQLKTGRKLKGALLLCAVNLLFLWGLFGALRAVGTLSRASTSGSVPDLLATLHTSIPAGGWFLAAFILIWGYGFFDALLSGPAPESHEKS